MRFTAWLVSALAWLFIASATIQVLRSDRSHRSPGFDVLLFLAVIALAPWTSRFGRTFLLVHAIFLAALPVLALRIIRHLRHVPSSVIWFYAVAAAGVAFTRVTELRWPIINATFQVSTMTAVAFVLGIGAVAGTGLSARRMAIAAAGAAFQGLAFSGVIVEGLVGRDTVRPDLLSLL
ncbi:MAG TPA: hypothetical protein VFO19_06170, partial [Vicinamibacterales bacterium]|nr:hypothetical protein [Vicinamibacterales bacterium]